MDTCETVEKFPVVMLYDHFSSVGAALTTYSYLACELQSECRPELRVWRMDVATSPEFSAEANDDIAAAEVIIMSVQGNPPWPAAFLPWKAGTGGGAPHAIIVLIDSLNGPAAANDRWNSALRSGATQIHPEVFVYETKGKSRGLAVPDVEPLALAFDSCTEVRSL